MKVNVESAPLAGSVVTEILVGAEGFVGNCVMVSVNGPTWMVPIRDEVEFASNVKKTEPSPDDVVAPCRWIQGVVVVAVQGVPELA